MFVFIYFFSYHKAVLYLSPIDNNTIFVNNRNLFFSFFFFFARYQRDFFFFLKDLSHLNTIRKQTCSDKMWNTVIFLIHHIENDCIELIELNVTMLGSAAICDIRLFSALFLRIWLTYLDILACSQETIFNYFFVLLRTCVNYTGNTSLSYSFINIILLWLK